MLDIIMQAPGATGQQPNIFGAVFPFILIGFVFYFLLIRPQNKRMKAHRAMLAAVTRGDTIVTNGGLIGKVTKVDEGELTIDLGSNQKVKIVSSMIADVRNKTVAANDSAKK
jgi:preprotein translocase subunit YajC